MGGTLHGAVHEHHAMQFAEVWRQELDYFGLPDLHGDPMAAVDARTAPLAALCLSGGGIRSASFALGALQALARSQLLGQFHYLSTVSGGGYVGAWLSAWRCAAGSDQEVFEALNQLPRTGVEPGEIKGIRADSNYLTPQLGVLSADTWTLIALYIRNLFLNWCVFVPFFLGCLLFPRLCLSILELPTLVPAAFGSHALSLLLGFASLMLGLSLTCNVFARNCNAARGFTRARFLYWVLVPILLAATALTLSTQLLAFDIVSSDFLLLSAPTGAVIYAVPWCIAALLLRKSEAELGVRDLLAWSIAGAVVAVLTTFEFNAVNSASVSPTALAIGGLTGVVGALFIGELVYVGLSSFFTHAEENREWLARSSGWLAATAGTWLVVCTVALYGPDLMHLLGSTTAKAVAGLSVGGVSGAITLIGGWSKKTEAVLSRAVAHQLSLTQMTAAAAVVFALSIGAGLAAFNEYIEALLATMDWSVGALNFSYAWDAIGMVAFIGLAAAVSYLVNINYFSLHALYRNRLIRAFLGSARANAHPRRRPDPFTGFDFDDNRRMTELCLPERPRLLHVINMALNVVSSSNPAWQERKAESFTVTPLACGNANVGYRPTRQFGDQHSGISLGTAMAISGAAVSPNQGYNSSPLIGFLLMLFNVRLGWWLGNPCGRSYDRAGPKFGLTPALSELAGATTDSGKWIYLSDGGHFENLGIYEMVRRRCRLIVVSDAGCDPKFTFEDLGNAARKCFIDFGVSINFKQLTIPPRQSAGAPVPTTAMARLAIGTIHYPNSDAPGVLIYVKPTYFATTEPPHVRSYASAHPEFPHEPTTDQWFSESQLEAYRALGAHIVEYICASGTDLTAADEPPALSLEEFVAAAHRCLDATAGRA